MLMQFCSTIANIQRFFDNSHFSTFSGVFRGGIEVLVRTKLALSDGVNMQLTVRSQDPDVSDLICSTIA